MVCDGDSRLGPRARTFPRLNAIHGPSRRKVHAGRISRAMKAAMAAGATAVLLKPDGVIRIELKAVEAATEPNPWDEDD
jgi:hypothetical protein